MRDMFIESLRNLTVEVKQPAFDTDHWFDSDMQPSQQPVDSEFLDAVCNGIITVGADLKIISQNYVSRINMGDLRGQTCHKVLENRDTPCENCPRLRTAGEHETSMRCAGKDCTLYEVSLFSSENGGVIEVYPDMISREVLMKNMHTCTEEMQLLREVVENVSSVLSEDVKKTF